MLLAVCVLAGLCACAQEESTGSSWKPPYYETAGFTQVNGRNVYDGESGTATKTGIDVSDHQGYIDWYNVAADGIEFAFIRAGYRGATEGSLFTDEYFDYNLTSAEEVGIERGVYFFSQAISVEEAREEARYVLSLLGDTSLEYPIAFDYERNAEGVESRIQGVSSEEATAIAQAFCEVIQRAGYRAALYGNSYDLNMYDLDAFWDVSLWYAEYGTAPMCRRPFTLWQYSNDGRVSGIEGAVDMNLDLSAAAPVDRPEDE